MNIGIDLDGVLFDTESYYRSLVLIYDIEHGGKGELHKEELLFQDRFEWPSEKAVEFLKSHYKEVLTSAPLMYFAKYVLEKLRAMGHKLFVITARGTHIQDEIDITKNIFEKEGLVFDDMFFGCKDKAKVCKELGIDLMIDDHYSNIFKVKNEGIKCLYYRDLVLYFIEDDLVHEVRNWADIYNEILHFDEWK